MARKRKAEEVPAWALDLFRKMRRAVREALLEHQRAGNPIAIWQDGHVVIVPPSRIPEVIGPAERGEDE